MKNFFAKIKRGDFILALEPRGKWWKNAGLVKEVCHDFDLVNCVDPLRNQAQHFGKAKVVYFRLHGFGKPSMYNYKFSNEELEKVKKTCDTLIKIKKARNAYVMFNNYAMYEDALRFAALK